LRTNYINNRWSIVRIESTVLASNMYSALVSALLLPAAWASPVHHGRETPSLSTSAPTETHQWAAGWNPSFNIHESCNSSLRAQLQQGLDETVDLAQHARDHLLRWGHASRFTEMYFGNGSTAHAIGWYDRIISADKTGMLFRCDDPDGNCATQKGTSSLTQASRCTDGSIRLGRALARLQCLHRDSHMPVVL
jgi:hypothetical protein